MTAQDNSMESRAVFSCDEKARRIDRPWLGSVLDVLDSHLRRRQAVFEYTCHPNCLFRIQLITSCDNVVLSDETHVHRGDRLIRLHVWNEQFPAFPAAGPTLAWARHFNRVFDISLRELAYFLEVRRGLDDVAAICANISFEPANRSAQLARFVSRFGFEKIAICRSQSFRERMHLFGENILISMIVLAHNATAFRADTLWRDRTLVFLSRQALQRRYGSVDVQ